MREQHDPGSDPLQSAEVSEVLDRNWNELLQELRVTQTGTQILTGFLLTLPFTSRFPDLTAGQERLYLVVGGSTAVLAAGAVLLFLLLLWVVVPLGARSGRTPPAQASTSDRRTSGSTSDP